MDCGKRNVYSDNKPCNFGNFLQTKIKNDYVEIKRSCIFHYWKGFKKNITNVNISEAQEACKVRNTSRHSQLCFLFFKLQDEGDNMFKIPETVALLLISFGLIDFQRGALDSVLLFKLSANYLGWIVSPLTRN